jgi:hypothetical protein
MLRFAIAALVGLAGLAGASTGASALNRTFVAGSNGNDANACTRAFPCATFTRALTQTDAGGEINVLDGGNFGQAFIDKSITIQNDGAGIFVRPNAGASVNAFLTRVQLKNNTTGFVLDGTNTVHFIGAKISDSTSFGNVQHGIQAISGSGGADIVVHNTMVAGNTNGLRAENAGGRILYSGSVISNNAVGLSTVSGGQLISNGTNRNRGNFTQGSPTSMHPLD